MLAWACACAAPGSTWNSGAPAAILEVSAGAEMRIENLVMNVVSPVADEFGEGRVISSLEGGYNLSALARSVGAHLKTLAQL